MKDLITQIRKLITAILAFAVGPAFTYLFQLAATSIVAWAVSAGFDLSVPVIPSSFGLFAFIALVKHILANFGKAWHSGRLLAEAEHEAANAAKAGLKFLESLLAADPASKPASPSGTF